MQHAGQLEVMHIDIRPNHLSWQIDSGKGFSDKRQLVSALRCRPAVRVPCKIDCPAKLPIGRVLVAFAPMNGPIAHEQLVAVDAEPLSCCVKKGSAHFRTGLSQCAATLDGRSAAGRDALVGTTICIRWDHADARVVDVQLFGSDLSERRDDPLADLDLSCSNFDDAILPDRNPTIEASIARETWGKRSGGHIRRPCPCSFLARTTDRTQDAIVGTTATKMDVELRSDLCVCRRGIAVEQSGRSHNDAGQAVAALPGLFLNERLLQRVEY